MKKLFTLTFLLIFCAIYSQQWQRTGGPIGGLGYNLKIDPTNNQIMYITDALSGVHKSSNGGATWVQKNNGITSRGGDSSDAIPVFTISIDGNNPTTIWAGTQYDSGLYKSTDSAENWVLKNTGIIESNIVFRNISVEHDNSNIIYASGELPTEIQGNEFEKVKGVIYKSTDGGENWTKIWEGDSLARWVCINGNDPTILTVSTGIFDREANNTTGMGLIKSTDGGTTWNQINNGITGSLFIGGMSDSHDNPELIYIASGNNAEVNYSTPIKGGVFKSTDFGLTWTQVIAPTDMIISGHTEHVFTAVKIAGSDQNIVYTASAHAFYKSTDAGATWVGYRGGTNTAPLPWGPSGVRAGVPIEITIDKTNPNILYAANYGGGIFKSIDGAQTWQILGSGYSGATIHKVAVDPQNSSTIISNGRSGPFKSTDKGVSYDGMYFGAASEVAEWYSAAIHPTNSNTLFITDEHAGLILKSTNGGNDWTTKFDHPNSNSDSVNDRHGVKEIVISKSNPNTIYAGYAYQSFYGDPYNTSFSTSFGVYKSTDTGETWTQSGTTGIAATNLNITALAVNDTDENNLYIGLRGDGLFHSTDGGVNWTNIGTSLPDQYIHSIVLSDNNTSIYAGTKSKGVYKSTDNGQNWTQVLSEVNTSTDFPTKMITTLAVNPANKNNIVAGDVHTGVYITTDAGATWTAINQGLTTKTVTSLVFSADGKTLFTGTKGEGIFTYDTSTLSVESYTNTDFYNHIYPNPTSDKIIIALQNSNLKTLDVSLFTLLGKQVIHKTFTVRNGKIEMDLPSLNSGVYVVKYTLPNGQTYNSKILIE